MKTARPRTDSLREKCVREALYRGVGRRGIKPSRSGAAAECITSSALHFVDRDHILAEIVDRTFAAFAKRLDARAKRGSPRDDLAGMGRAYVKYARKHPLQYRLLFGTPLPDPHRQ